MRWSPVSQQEYLQLLAGERKTLTKPPDEFGARIPAGCAQLAFAIGSVRCWNAQPLFFEDFGAAAHWELCARMAACLSYMNQCHIPAAHVLPPTPLSDAILAGLRLWIQQLANDYCWRGWDVQLGPKDVAYLELREADNESRRSWWRCAVTRSEQTVSQS